MANFWMVRAGEGGYLFGQFEQANCVAIGWEQDFTDVKTLEDAKRILADPDAHQAAVGNAAAMVYKFRQVMKEGDRVVTYDPKSRQYLLGAPRPRTPLGAP